MIKSLSTFESLCNVGIILPLSVHLELVRGELLRDGLLIDGAPSVIGTLKPRHTGTLSYFYAARMLPVLEGF